MEQGTSSVCLVVAAAGYGKTTALRHRYPQPQATWYRANDLDLRDSHGLAGLGQGTAPVVIDGLPRLAGPAARVLRTAMASWPAGTPLVISSRWPLDAASAIRLRPADLRLSTEDIGHLLATGYDLTAGDLAAQVREVTAGWPALVRLTAEALATGGVPAGSLLPLVAEPDGPLGPYVRTEVLGPLPERVRRLLGQLAGLAPVTPGLCAALGFPGAGPELALLQRIGVLIGAGDGPAGPRVVPAVAAVLGQSASRRRLVVAAGWYRRNELPGAAALAYRDSGDLDCCAEVMAESGDRMITTGSARTVAELIGGLPAKYRTRRLRLLRGDALRTAGEVAAAAYEYAEVAAGETAWDPGLAWRMGIIEHLRGRQAEALAAFARGDEADGTPVDRALLLAWRATATARHGDAPAGVEHARRAYRLAAAAGDDGASATAHVSLALCLGLTGDEVGSEEHYHLAMGLAERTGDLVLLARIGLNQSYHLAKRARFPEALELARRAVRHADLAGHANLRCLAMENEADNLAMLGRYDEAVERYAGVLGQHGRLGSRMSAAALLGLADVYRLRGWREQARSAYEDAARRADEGAINELAVRARCGLALVLVADNPAAALRVAGEAGARAAGDDLIPAMLAMAGVKLANGDRDAALAHANEAVDRARTTGQRAALADALELRAAAGTDPDRDRAALREAHGIWTAAGATAHADRTVIMLSRLPGAPIETRFEALIAASRLAAENVSVGGSSTGTDVLIKALGRFEAYVNGELVPAAAWQSRRARDLLRILVVRRGRPVPRAELCELLWPDDDPGRTGHRLSVLLSIVRGALDPERAQPAEHYLVADAASVALDVTHLRVDVIDLLYAVAHGRRRMEQGDRAGARAVLTTVDREYPGELFEDEPYTDLADGLREQTRAARLELLRMLAELGPDTGTTVHHLHRLLEHDRYDEHAHRSLVRTLVNAGQHGEARRALGRYREAMIAIDVRPPEADILVPARVTGGGRNRTPPVAG